MADEKKIGQVVMEAYNLEKQLASILVQLDERKQIIQKYFDDNGIKTLEVKTKNPGSKIFAKKSERVSIKYDAEKLKKKLDPEIFNEVTKKTYTITDIEAMIKLVKNAGISGGDFKKLLDVQVEVDRNEMKRLYDAKEIDMTDIKGCYTASISKSIKIEEGKGESD